VFVGGFGGVVLSVKVWWSKWSVLSLPPPTIRPREQADLARYRSFVVSQCGFGF